MGCTVLATGVCGSEEEEEEEDDDEEDEEEEEEEREEEEEEAVPLLGPMYLASTFSSVPSPTTYFTLYVLLFACTAVIRAIPPGWPGWLLPSWLRGCTWTI